MTESLTRHDGCRIAGGDDLIFVGLADATFVCHEEASSALHALCSEHEGCRHTSTVSDTTGCQHRDLHCVYHLRDQSHCVQLSDVTTRLAAFSHYGARTDSLHQDGECRGCDNWYDLDACFQPSFHVFRWIARTCSDDIHFLFDNHFRNLLRKWALQHDVDTERFFRHCLALAYFFSDVFCVGVHGGDESQTSRF